MLNWGLWSLKIPCSSDLLSNQKRSAPYNINIAEAAVTCSHIYYYLHGEWQIVHYIGDRQQFIYPVAHTQWAAVFAHQKRLGVRYLGHGHLGGHKWYIQLCKESWIVWIGKIKQLIMYVSHFALTILCVTTCAFTGNVFLKNISEENHNWGELCWENDLSWEFLQIFL